MNTDVGSAEQIDEHGAGGKAHRKGLRLDHVADPRLVHDTSLGVRVRQAQEWYGIVPVVRMC